MKKINIIEVGPRDGFQNIDEYIPIDNKLTIIRGILDSGVRSMELTSFVSPKAIPQMKDAKEISKVILSEYPDLDIFPLIPNLYGANIASELGFRKAAYVVSLSETHNKENINRSHGESYDELKKIIIEYPDIEIILDLATAFGCPFEGEKNLDDIIEFIHPYIEELNITNLCLCDTIGIAYPTQIREFIIGLREHYPILDIQVHIHDTRNMGMVNTLAAIEEGVLNVQSSLGGLGGCPFAPGASGNLASEDLVYMLDKMNYDVGIEFDKLLKIAKKQVSLIEGNYSGHHINI